MKSTITIVLFFLLPVFVYPQQNGLITVTEVMFNAPFGNGEFIEIYNLSADKALDLSHFKIKYQTSNPDTIVPAGNQGMILGPGSYAVVLEGDYDFTSGGYKDIIPRECLLLRIKDNAFGSTGMANTVDRTIAILDQDNDTLELYLYTAGNRPGYSDEKILRDKNNAPSNWGNSLNFKGTPGRKNSIAPRDFDLSLENLSTAPQSPIESNDILLSFTIKNHGLLPAENFTAEIYCEENSDSLFTGAEKLYSKALSMLMPGDSIVITYELAGFKAGSYLIKGNITFNKDENPQNNAGLLRLLVRAYQPGYNDLVINEVMFAPQAGEPEWIELYNRSSATINLSNWKLSDYSSSVYITQKDRLLKPGEYALLCRDSSLHRYYNFTSQLITFSLPALNNSGDRVVIKDSAGSVIDSMEYSASPATLGRSLERVDAYSPSYWTSNWQASHSLNRCTPGSMNSVSRKDFDLALTQMLFTPPFPFLHDKITLSARVKNTGRMSIQFSLWLFSPSSISQKPGKLLASSELLSLSPEDSLLYTFDYSGEISREVSFIIQISSSLDQDSTNNSICAMISPGYKAGTLVINEIMYMPETPEPEWIEIYNTSDDTVNIKGWTVSDILATPAEAIISQHDELIPPKTFLVIAKDSAIINSHSDITSKIICAQLPAFNNDEDGVILRDNRQLTMDSLRYQTPVGSPSGHSLERKFTGKASGLRDNWGFSKAWAKSTPGRINSITPRDYDISVEEVFTFPSQPRNKDEIFLGARIYNRGLKEARNFSVRFLYRYNSTDPFIELNELSDFSLKTTDSLIITNSPSIPPISSKITVAVEVVFKEDGEPSNNYMEKVIEPGYYKNALLINEVMFSPPPNRSEWIEIFNASADTLNLRNWYISDLLPSPSRVKISANDLLLFPGGYLVIARDSSFHKMYPYFQGKVSFVAFSSLGNSEDGIVISDLKGNTIDSLKYSSGWGREARSIERITPDNDTNDKLNWQPSVALWGATPGSENSVTDIIPYSRNMIVINEIMYEPGKGNCEFIELFNSGDEPVNLANWEIVNESGASFYASDGNYTLAQGEYYVIAADSSVLKNYAWLRNSESICVKNSSSLGLANYDGVLHLQDAFQNTIDSVHYFYSWHSKNIPEVKNRSLERINPSLSSNDALNWRTAVNEEGATPGKLNSIFVLNQKQESRFSVLPNPFSPDNDGVEDFAIINYNLSPGVNQVLVKVFDSQGRLVRTLHPDCSGAHGSLIFDGLNDNGSPLRMGIYIILLQALDERQSVSDTIKSVVVVAKKF